MDSLSAARRNYARVAQAIRFIRDHRAEQPDLTTVARHLHLSECHFQRLFTAWAGISPKRFLQFLTVEYAKASIADSRNLLDLTFDAGLSSPGRLHDLFVTFEAMSPGEYQAGGAGLALRYGVHDTPVGAALIATTARGICNLHFLDRADGPNAEAALRREWPNAKLRCDPSTTQPLIDSIFNAAPCAQQLLTLHIKGSNFQLQTWRALLRIPYGEITSYQRLAATLGRPTAARAVGHAVAHNPVAYLIPCHRVLRESGELGDYRWGLERKAALIGWEAAHTAARS
ncbi:MAG: methylated-DNA--[protein]-cysteine S-methyltransferase [Candidatus Competibacteraceae bacterium]|nr:methylated-DNA--[protein]-cysteine S-methyltransferase [Candidatus Competibacteraceae bacterium]